MDTETVTSKTVRQRLGGLLLDIRYVPTKVFLVEKAGSDDYVAVICNADWLHEQGVEIPDKGAAPKTETKPETKKKK